MAVGQIAVGQGRVRGLFIRSSALPSVGITKRSYFAALRLSHSAAQAWCLGRFEDRGSRINQGRTLPNREVISRQFLSGDRSVGFPLHQALLTG